MHTKNNFFRNTQNGISTCWWSAQEWLLVDRKRNETRNQNFRLSQHKDTQMTINWWALWTCARASETERNKRTWNWFAFCICVCVCVCTYACERLKHVNAMHNTRRYSNRRRWNEKTVQKECCFHTRLPVRLECLRFCSLFGSPFRRWHRAQHSHINKYTRTMTMTIVKTRTKAEQSNDNRRIPKRIASERERSTKNVCAHRLRINACVRFTVKIASVNTKIFSGWVGELMAFHRPLCIVAHRQLWRRSLIFIFSCSFFLFRLIFQLLPVLFFGNLRVCAHAAWLDDSRTSFDCRYLSKTTKVSNYSNWYALMIGWSLVDRMSPALREKTSSRTSSG